MHEQKQAAAAGANLKSRRRAADRKPGRPAQGAGAAGHAGESGHALARHSRNWAGQDCRRLPDAGRRGGDFRARGGRAFSAGAEGISDGHAAGAEHSGVENAAGQRAAAGGSHRFGKMEGSGGHGGGRRHSAHRYPVTKSAARVAKPARGNAEVNRGAASLNAPSLNVGVVGATGYAGFELATLLLRHPRVAKSTFYLRDGHADVHCLTQLYPQLRGRGDAPCVLFSVDAIASSGADVIFLSTPHEVSLKLVPALLAANPSLRVVDLSGAFRFQDGEVFSRWYKLEAPEATALGAAVYGLPELYSDKLAGARLVANPGCYPTSVILGLQPLVKAGWIDARRGIVCDCKSGVSGAGKEPKSETHFVSVSENFRAYNLFKHRHTPEVQEHLGLTLDNFIFTTHLLPVARGILSSLYVWLDGARKAEEVETLYRYFYAGRPLVRVLPAGTLPELSDVTHTNFCHLGFALDPSGERLVVVACLDNLGKGAAGQAIQNMNAMFGFEETTGLI